jgi:protein SCO1/2
VARDASPKVLVLALAFALGSLAGCERQAPARQYPLKGQVLAVNTERQEITIKHDDIPNLMPGMTMSFPVASADLLKGREPGELVTATLEVTDAMGRLTSITRTGFTALPANSNQAELAAGLLKVGDPAPDVALVDTRNRRRSFAEWRGTATLVTFIYTNCPLPNFCPLMDQNFATLQRAIAEDATLRGRVRLLSVSFDPERDTPDVLAAHAARFKADPAVWEFVTGDRVAIDRFAAKFGVGLLRADGETEITHNLRTTLIGADGRIVKIYSGNDWTPGTVLADLRTTVRRP